MAQNQKINLGKPPGRIIEATIAKNNQNGTIDARVNEADALYIKNIPYTSNWYGPQGQFMGGDPIIGSTIMITQGVSGKWYMIGAITSNSAYENFSSSSSTNMSALRNGRALIQVENGHKILLDPSNGIRIGDENNYIHINSSDNIYSYTFDQVLNFTEASRTINGIVKRDLATNASRNVLGYLDSHAYDKSLFTVAMEPSSSFAAETDGSFVRNPPLVENRSVYYEFADSADVDSYENEIAKYIDQRSPINKPATNRKKLRTDAISLNLLYPNHLVEQIVGTVVDTFGNILDINRAILPIGKIPELSFKDGVDNSETFINIHQQLRKSIAYHFEINARKNLNDIVLPKDTVSDYDRNNSKFSIDIDKEGQFKINVPASSETGNVPLLTRYHNFSTLLARDNNEFGPNSFVRSEDNTEIYLNSFAKDTNIELVSGADELTNFASPLDRNTDQPIKAGTAHHDITKTCIFLTENSPRLPDAKQVHPYTDEDNRLNNTTHFTPYEQIVSSSIQVSGDDANAGGRSGMINLDGMVAINIGANTIDRQSLWLDTAGGIVSNIGRDKQGISYAANLDGDLIIQVGNAGIGNTVDSRFADQNDSFKNGVVDIRVIVNNGQQIIFRMSSSGIDLYSPGAINITAQQNINIKTNGTFSVDSTNYQTHAGSTKKVVQKFPQISS